MLGVNDQMDVFPDQIRDYDAVFRDDNSAKEEFRYIVYSAAYKSYIDEYSGIVYGNTLNFGSTQSVNLSALYNLNMTNLRDLYSSGAVHHKNYTFINSGYGSKNKSALFELTIRMSNPYERDLEFQASLCLNLNLTYHCMGERIIENGFVVPGNSIYKFGMKWDSSQLWTSKDNFTNPVSSPGVPLSNFFTLYFMTSSEIYFNITDPVLHIHSMILTVNLGTEVRAMDGDEYNSCATTGCFDNSYCYNNFLCQHIFYLMYSYVWECGHEGCIPNTFCDQKSYFCRKCDEQCSTCFGFGFKNCKSCYQTSPSPYWHSKRQFTTSDHLCPFEYISLNTFDNIDVNVPIPTTYRMTIEFWIFIHNGKDLTDSLLRPSFSSIILKDFFVFGFYPENIYDDNVNVNFALFPFEFYYPFPNDIIAYPELQSFMNQYPDIQYVKSTISNSTSKWIFVRGGISYHHKEMYMNNETSPLNPIEFFTGVHYKTLMRKFYRKEQKTNLRFQGFAYVNSLIYLRNFNVFTEYIPITYRSQYFNLHKITSIKQFPQLLFSIPFDNTEIYSDSLLANATLYDYSSQFTSRDNAVGKETISFDYIRGDLRPPNNFRRLKLLDGGVNLQYTTTDLSSKKAIDCPGPNNALCFDDDKPMVCAHGNSLLLENMTCGNDCNRTMRLPNNKIDFISNGKIRNNICGFKCNDTSIDYCPNNNDELSTMTCKNNHTSIFYQCLDNDDYPPNESALHFSGVLNTHSIEFNLGSNYDTFLIEMWLHPDLLYQISPPLSKEYIFKTNSHEIYYSPEDEAYELKVIIDGVDSKFKIEQKQYHYGWNHFIFQNKPILSRTYSEFRLSFLNNLQLIGSAVGIASMNQICFCNNDLCCGSTNIKWSNVFIKDLKVWNADVVTDQTLIHYDKFSYKRPYGLLHYFKLSINNLNLNEIIDSFDPTIKASFPSHVFELNPDQDMNYNYGWNFSWNQIHYPSFATNTVIESNNKANVTLNETCDSGCSVCFGVSKFTCLKCNDGYALSGATCTVTSLNKSYYYLMNPSNNSGGNSISLKVSDLNLNSYPSITFFCYLKLYGFVNEEMINGNTDLIIFDINEDFVLRYDPLTFNINLSLLNQIHYSDKNFNEKFGQWIPISIAAFRSSDLNLQPHMSSMTLGSEPLNNLVLPAQCFSFTMITIAKGMIGSIAQVTLFNQFILNAIGYAQHYNTPSSLFSHSIIIRHFALRSLFKRDCISNDDIEIAEAGIVCNEDYISLIDQLCLDDQFVSVSSQNLPPKCVDNASKCDNIIQTSTIMSNCDYLYATCDTISRNSINNMPFDYTNNQNENYIICGKSNTLDIARYEPNRIANILSPNDEFKLEFWFLTQSYVNINFGSLIVSWHRHIKIKVKYEDNTFKAHCYALIDNNNDLDDGIGIGFSYVKNSTKENIWRYVVCGVNIATNEYYITNLQKGNDSKGVIGKDPNLIPTLTTVDLVISEGSRTNFGVSYIRELRLWNCYYCASNRAFVVFNPEDKKFNKVIHYFKFEDTSGLIKDYSKNALAGDLNISIQLIQKSGFNGYGLLKKIPELPNCNENGFSYFNLNTGMGCDVMFNMNALPDITFPNLPSSKTNRYTIDIWFYIESANDFTNGFNVIFDQHIALSSFANSISDTNITIYCFPQAYRDHLYKKQGIEISEAFNNAQNKLEDTISNGYSKWNYVRCAYNYDTREAYINDQSPIDIQAEVFYSEPTRHVNVFPFKFFPNFYTNLLINGFNNNYARIFIQTINIYREYIPQSIVLKYLQMKQYANIHYYPLLFAVDFQNDYDIITNRLKYYFIDQDYVFDTPSYLDKFISQAEHKDYETYPVYDTFVQCGNGKRYNASKNQCEIITSPPSCDKTNTFCIDNDTYFFCRKNQYLNINTLQCAIDCPLAFTRMPDVLDGYGMCQYPCDQFTSCPTSNSNLKQGNYENEFKCDEYNNMTRVYYECFSRDSIQSSSIYFSSKYYFTNTIASYSSLNLEDYFVDFWFMLERIESFRFLNEIQRRTLFIAYPHFITRIGKRIEYNNQFIPNKYYQITTVNSFDWNRIVIENYVIEGKTLIDTFKYINIYLNNNYSKPVVTISITNDNSFALAQIAFCSHANSKYSPCTLGLNSFSYKIFEPIWEDAFYKDIIVWNRKGTNLGNINSFNNSYKEYTSNIISFHSMTIESIHMKNIASRVNSPRFDLIAKYNTFNDYDKSASVNYATGIDIGRPDSAISQIDSKYDDDSIPMFSSTNCKYTLVKCVKPCLRCFSSRTDDCYTCIDGYILSGTSCVKSTNYYFKTPTTNNAINSAIDLNIDLLSYNEITITFFVKFLGVIKGYRSVTSLLYFYETDNYIGWNDDNNSFCLIYNNDQIAFDFNNSRIGIGEWTLFGLAISKGRINSENNQLAFPSMINLMVNREIIKPTKEFEKIIMSTLIDFNKLQLSNQASAFFYDLRLFSKYYLGSFGIGQDPNSISLPSFITRRLFKSSSPDETCFNPIENIGANYCVSDYNQYDDIKYNCPGTNYQFRIINAFDQTVTCYDCDSNCLDYCHTDNSNGCTCSIDSGYNWIRNESSYYCEKLDSLNIAQYSPITINNINQGGKSYIIELWVFILSYFKESFNGIDVSWDKFNRIEIINGPEDTLIAKCYPFVDITDYSKYTENISLNINKANWEFIRCLIDLEVNQQSINDKKDVILNPMTRPSITAGTKTRLIIEDKDRSPYPYGIALIRELRIWNNKHYLFYDTSRINLAIDSTYTNLIHYFKNVFLNSETQRNYIYDQMTNTNQILTVTRQYNYYSYISSYEKLVLCDEGQIYKLSPITNKYECLIYKTEDLLDSLIKDTTKYSPDEIINKAKILNEMAYNKTVIPNSKDRYSAIINSKDNNGNLTLNDPDASNAFCNNKGIAKIVDRYLCCYCFSDYIGDYCQLNTEDYKNLDKIFSHFLKKAFETFNNYNSDKETEDKVLKAFDYLLTGSAVFMIDNDFNTLFLNKFSEIVYSSTQCREDLLSIADHFFSNIFILTNRFKVSIISNMQSAFNRNAKLNYLQKDELKPNIISIKQVIEYLAEKCLSKLSFINSHFTFKTENFFLDLIQVNKEFNYESFFNKNKDEYLTHFSLKNCIKNNKNAMVINWLNNPYYFNEDIYWNYTSSYITIKAFSLEGEQMTLDDCDDSIKFNISNHNPIMVPIINENKHFFKKENIYSPNDSIFTEPYFIEANGRINTSTIEERIKKYFFEYRMVFKYLDAKTFNLSTKGLSYIDFNEENSYFICESKHLSDFILTFEYNEKPNRVDGRLYFLKHLNLFSYGPNYNSNYGFFAMMAISGVYLLNLIICLLKLRSKKHNKTNDVLFKETIQDYAFPYGNIEGEYLFKEDTHKKIFKEEIINSNNKSDNRLSDKLPSSTTNQLPSSQLNTKENDVLFINRKTLPKNQFEDFFNKVIDPKDNSLKHKINNPTVTIYDSKTKLKSIHTSSNNNYLQSESRPIQEYNEDYINPAIDYRHSKHFIHTYHSIDYRIYNEDFRTRIYQKMTISCFKFFWINFSNRNIYLSSFKENIVYTPGIKSLYLPMYLILMLFSNTLVYLFSTSIEYNKIFNEHLLPFIGFIFVSIAVSNAYFYLKSILYNIKPIIIRELLLKSRSKPHSIQSSLSIHMKHFNTFFIIETVFFGMLWIITLLFSFGLCAVYKNNGLCLVMSFSIGLAFDFLLSFILELAIALLYTCRKNSIIIIIIDRINRLKSFKVISP